MITSEVMNAALKFSVEGLEHLQKANKSLDDITKTSRWTAVGAAMFAFDKGIQVVTASLGKVQQLLSKTWDAAAEKEATHATWLSLLGKEEAVTRRIADIRGFYLKSPFLMADVQNTSIQLENLGLYSMKALKAAGDVAAIRSRTLSEATTAMTAFLRGEAEQLRGFGVSTLQIEEELGHKLVETTKRTARDNQEIWDAIVDAMVKKGHDGMKAAMETAKGIMTNLKGVEEEAYAAVGRGMLTPGKKGMAATIDLMQKMLDDGTFDRMGEALGGTLSKAVNVMLPMMENLATRNALIGKARAGWSEQFLAPELSAIPQRRTAASMVSAALENNSWAKTPDYVARVGTSGVSKFVTGMAGTSKDPYVQGVIDKAALMLLNGGETREVAEFIVGATRSYAYQLTAREKFNLSPSSLRFAGFSHGMPLLLPRDAEFGRSIEAKTFAATDPFASLREKAAAKLQDDRLEKQWMASMGLPGSPTMRDVFAQTSGLSDTPYGPPDAGRLRAFTVADAEKAAKDAFGGEGKGRARSSKGGTNFWAQVWKDHPISEVKDRYDQLKGMTEQWAVDESEALERILDKHKDTMTTRVKLARTMVDSIGKVSELLFADDKRRAIKGKDLAEFVAKTTTAAILREIGEQQSKKAAVAYVDAFNYAVEGNWTKAAGKVAVGLKYTAIAGVLGGAAALMESGANASWDRATKKDEEAKAGASTSSSRGPTAREVSAAGAPSVINFNVTVNHYGSVVYGSGGTEQWLDMELVPALKRRIASGDLALP
jgi:hypothetical protein